jgi:hypothetical protein
MTYGEIQIIDNQRDSYEEKRLEEREREDPKDQS